MGVLSKFPFQEIAWIPSLIQWFPSLIIEVDTPFLLLLANINYLGLKFNNLENTIILLIYLVLVI